MVRGMIIAVRSVISALFLLMILVYVFGIVFNRLLGNKLYGADEHQGVNYSTLSESMWSLAFSATLLDNITVEADEIQKANPLMFLLYIFFFIITHLTSRKSASEHGLRVMSCRVVILTTGRLSADVCVCSCSLLQRFHRQY